MDVKTLTNLYWIYQRLDLYSTESHQAVKTLTTLKLKWQQYSPKKKKKNYDNDIKY
jgi:hypothetical protein